MGRLVCVHGDAGEEAEVDDPTIVHRPRCLAGRLSKTFDFDSQLLSLG